jgi:predicted nucleotidyltransferase component of viral defense system
MIKEWLNEYKTKNTLSTEIALREIMQEIALAGLAQSNFFERAAFYGGTALRIFHDLPRFSEDLDFSLLDVEPNFSLDLYLDGMREQFSALGMQVSIKEKEKSRITHIDSAFLKTNTTWKELILKGVSPQEKTGLRPDIKIKIEVDTRPPLGFATEEKLLLKPYSFYVKCFSLPDLFAGKMHVLLFRKWKRRVKGRDWFDFEWYVKKSIPLHLDHLMTRAVDSGDWPAGKEMKRNELMSLLIAKIKNVYFEKIREDIVKFIPDAKVLDIWSPKYFLDLARHIKLE